MLAQDSSRTLQQRFSGFRQKHFTRRAYKQRRTQLQLHLLNLHANRCLRDVNTQRASSECAAFGNRRERSQLSDFHSRSAITDDYCVDKIF
jgi:hypothetical protein